MGSNGLSGAGSQRIAIVTRGDLYPTHHGAAVKIVRTAEYLSLHGADVFVVTDSREHYLAYSKGMVREVKYGTKFRASQEWPGFAGGGRFANKLCERIGYPIEEYFLYSAQFDPAWWARVLYVGRVEKITTYQAEFPGYGAPCWLASKLLGGSSSIVQHNVEWDRLQDVSGLSDDEVANMRRLELWALKRVDDVIAVSLDDKQRMVDAGVSAEKITVIPHGVDSKSYVVSNSDAIRLKYGIGKSAPLLFFHGTLHYWPNTQAVRFIAEELLPILTESHPDLVVLIAGMSPPTYYRHPQIIFPGPVENLPAHISAADLTICPVPSGGGTRMKLLEYFAAGQACVSTTKGAEGITYVDGREIVIADSADEFASAVVDLLADEARRADIGAAAKRFVAHYDWTSITGDYVKLYNGSGRGGNSNDSIRMRIDRGEEALEALSLPRQSSPSVNGEIGAHLPPREPSKPRTLLLSINRGCNLRCEFCDLYDNPQEMDFDKAVSLLDEAVKIDTKVLVITGGEPFIYKRLFDLVGEAKKRGLGVNITTNGTLLEKRWDEFITSGVDSISVSIDGATSKVHDDLRGQKGCYNRTMKGLKRVLENGTVGASIYTVVTNKNVDQLLEIYETTRELGTGFDFWPVNDAKDLYLTTDSEKEAYRAAVEKIAESDPVVAQRKEFDRLGLNYHADEIERVRCLGLIDQYGVNWNGDLLPCCVWGASELVVGNVLESKLSKLWKSSQVQALRESMYCDGCEAGCFNHSLYEFTYSTGESFRVK